MTKLSNFLKAWNDNAFNMRYVRAAMENPKKNPVYNGALSLRPVSGELISRTYNRIILIFDAIIHRKEFDHAVEVLDLHKQIYQKEEAACKTKMAALRKQIYDVAKTLDANEKKTLGSEKGFVSIDKTLAYIDSEIAEIDEKLLKERKPDIVKDLVRDKARFEYEKIELLKKQLKQVEAFKNGLQSEPDENVFSEIEMLEEEQLAVEQERPVDQEDVGQARQRELLELQKQVEDEKKILKKMLFEVRSKFRQGAKKVEKLQGQKKNLEEVRKGKAHEHATIEKELSPFSADQKAIREQLEKDEKSLFSLGEQLQQIELDIGKAKEEYDRLEKEMDAQSNQIGELGATMRADELEIKKQEKALLDAPKPKLSFKKIPPNPLIATIQQLKDKQELDQEKWNGLRLQIIKLRSEQDLTRTQAEEHKQTKERLLADQNKCTLQIENNEKELISSLQAENHLLEKFQMLSQEISGLEKEITDITEELVEADDNQQRLKFEWDSSKDSREMLNLGDETLEGSDAEGMDTGNESSSKESISSVESTEDVVHPEIIKQAVPENKTEPRKSIKGEPVVELSKITEPVLQVEKIQTAEETLLTITAEFIEEDSLKKESFKEALKLDEKKIKPPFENLHGLLAAIKDRKTNPFFKQFLKPIFDFVSSFAVYKGTLFSATQGKSAEDLLKTIEENSQYFPNIPYEKGIDQIPTKILGKLNQGASIYPIILRHLQEMYGKEGDLGLRSLVKNLAGLTLPKDASQLKINFDKLIQEPVHPLDVFLFIESKDKKTENEEIVKESEEKIDVLDKKEGGLLTDLENRFQGIKRRSHEEMLSLFEEVFPKETHSWDPLFKLGLLSLAMDLTFVLQEHEMLNSENTGLSLYERNLAQLKWDREHPPKTSAMDDFTKTIKSIVEKLIATVKTTRNSTLIRESIFTVAIPGLKIALWGKKKIDDGVVNKARAQEKTELSETKKGKEKLLAQQLKQKAITKDVYNDNLNSLGATYKIKLTELEKKYEAKLKEIEEPYNAITALIEIGAKGGVALFDGIVANHKIKPYLDLAEPYIDMFAANANLNVSNKTEDLEELFLCRTTDANILGKLLARFDDLGETNNASISRNKEMLGLVQVDLKRRQKQLDELRNSSEKDEISEEYLTSKMDKLLEEQKRLTQNQERLTKFQEQLLSTGDAIKKIIAEADKKIEPKAIQKAIYVQIDKLESELQKWDFKLDMTRLKWDVAFILDNYVDAKAEQKLKEKLFQEKTKRTYDILSCVKQFGGEIAANKAHDWWLNAINADFLKNLTLPQDWTKVDLFDWIQTNVLSRLTSPIKK